MKKKLDPAKRARKAKPAASAIPFHVPDDEYSRIRDAQQKRARELAEQLQQGERLPPHDAGFVAAILIYWADNLPSKPKRAPGRSRTFPAGDAALCYAEYRTRAQPLPHGKALAEVADLWEVSPQAIEQAIAPYRSAAFALLFRLDPGNGR